MLKVTLACILSTLVVACGGGGGGGGGGGTANSPPSEDDTLQAITLPDNGATLQVAIDAVVQVGDDYVEVYSDQRRSEVGIPPNLYIRSLDAPSAFATLPRQEALLQAALLGGLVQEDIRDSSPLYDGLKVDARTFGRYHFILYEEETSKILVFNTGVEDFFESQQFAEIQSSARF